MARNSVTQQRRPPLRMVAAFEAVARLGQRGAAAAELNVTVGAINKQLRALEQWLGVPLFKEDWRIVTEMTPAGRRLAVAVTSGMETIQNGVSEITALRPPARDLHILVPASLSLNWLMPLLPRLEQDVPSLRIRLQPTHTGEDWLGLPHDAAIRRDGYLPDGYARTPLFQESLTAFAAPSLVQGRQGCPIEAMPLIESRTRLGDLDRWLAAAGVTRIGITRRQCAHFYTAYEAAISGAGVVVAPTILAAADAAAGRLLALDHQIAIPGACHVLLTPGRNDYEAHLLRFSHWLREQVADFEFSSRTGLRHLEAVPR